MSGSSAVNLIDQALGHSYPRSVASGGELGLSALFGKQSLTDSQLDYPTVTNYTLPDIIRGKNVFIETVIKGLIVAQPVVETLILCPWAKTGLTSIKWNRVIFNKPFIGPVPHEGTSRLVTQRKQAFGAAIERRGIGFQMEVDALNQPEGIIQYRQNVQALVSSTIQLQQLDTLNTLVHAGQQQQHKQWISGVTSNSVHEEIEIVNKWFGCLHRTKHSFLGLAESARRMLFTTRQVTGPYVLVCGPETGIYIQQVTSASPTPIPYTKVVDGSPVSMNDILSKITISPGTQQAIYVVEVPDYAVSENPIPLPPLTRHRIIAEHYYMTLSDFRCNNLWSGIGYRGEKDGVFRTCWRNIKIYNMAKNCYSTIDFIDAFRHAGGFDRNILDALHQRYLKSGSPSDFYPELTANGTIDPDFYKKGNKAKRKANWKFCYNPEDSTPFHEVRLFGQMDSNVSTADDVKRAAQSLLSGINGLTEEDEKIFLEGEKLYDKDLSNAPYNHDFMKFLIEENKPFNYGEDGSFVGEDLLTGAPDLVNAYGYRNILEWKGSEYGGLRLPDLRNATLSASFTPPLLQSYAGMRELSKHHSMDTGYNPVLTQVSHKFMRIWDILFDRMSNSLECVGADPTLRVPWHHPVDGLAAFWGCVYGERDPVMLFTPKAITGGTPINYPQDGNVYWRGLKVLRTTEGGGMSDRILDKTRNRYIKSGQSGSYLGNELIIDNGFGMDDAIYKYVAMKPVHKTAENLGSLSGQYFKEIMNTINRYHTDGLIDADMFNKISARITTVGSASAPTGRKYILGLRVYMLGNNMLNIQGTDPKQVVAFLKSDANISTDLNKTEVAHIRNIIIKYGRKLLRYDEGQRSIFARATGGGGGGGGGRGSGKDITLEDIEGGGSGSGTSTDKGVSNKNKGTEGGGDSDEGSGDEGGGEEGSGEEGGGEGGDGGEGGEEGGGEGGGEGSTAKVSAKFSRFTRAPSTLEAVAITNAEQKIHQIVDDIHMYRLAADKKYNKTSYLYIFPVGSIRRGGPDFVLDETDDGMSDSLRNRLDDSEREYLDAIRAVTPGRVSTLGDDITSSDIRLNYSAYENAGWYRCNLRMTPGVFQTVSRHRAPYIRIADPATGFTQPWIGGSNDPSRPPFAQVPSYIYERFEYASSGHPLHKERENYPIGRHLQTYMDYALTKDVGGKYKQRTNPYESLSKKKIKTKATSLDDDILDELTFGPSAKRQKKSGNKFKGTSKYKDPEPKGWEYKDVTTKNIDADRVRPFQDTRFLSIIGESKIRDLVHWTSMSNFIRNYKEARMNKSGLERVMAIAFILSKCDSEDDWVKAMNANVCVPINIILFRPFIGLLMESMILMKPGLPTGANFIGNGNFMLGADASTKTLLGNLTFTSKCVVYNPDNVLLLPDVKARSYDGGMDATYIDNFNGITTMDASERQSLLPLLVSACENEFDPHLSLTGFISYPDQNLVIDSQMTSPQFSSAEYYNMKYNFESLFDLTQSDDVFHKVELPRVSSRGKTIPYLPTIGGFDLNNFTDCESPLKGGCGIGDSGVWQGTEWYFATARG